MGSGPHRVFSSRGSRISLPCSHEQEVSRETNLSSRQIHIDPFQRWGVESTLLHVNILGDKGASLMAAVGAERTVTWPPLGGHNRWWT